MAIDYKHRTLGNRTAGNTYYQHNQGMAAIKLRPAPKMRLLIPALILMTGFTGVLVSHASTKQPSDTVLTKKLTVAELMQIETNKAQAALDQKKSTLEASAPKFYFYDLLPQNKVAVANYQLNAR